MAILSASLFSKVLTISGLFRLPRSLFILSRWLCLLSFLYEADQSLAFSLILLKSTTSTDTFRFFSDYEGIKIPQIRRYALIVSAVYFVSVYSLRKVSQTRVLLNKEAILLRRSIVSRIWQNWELCCLDNFWSFLPPSADCKHAQNVEIALISLFPVANSIITLSSLMDQCHSLSPRFQLRHWT